MKPNTQQKTMDKPEKDTTSEQDAEAALNEKGIAAEAKAPLGAEDILPEASAAERAAEEQFAAIKAAWQEEINKLKDQLLRQAAETENVRKRAQRDTEETSKYAITGFARDLVNVIENLQRATQSIPPEAREKDPLLKNLGEGVDMTNRELLNIIEKHGIKRIHPMGEKFDHNFHQAVAQIESADVEPGMVVQVLQAGYVIHDRLLIPAMVAVATRTTSQPQHIDTKA